MNAPDQLDRMAQWRAEHPAWPHDPNSGPTTLEDPETLLRQRMSGGLSKRAFMTQRRPAPIKVDELGYDRRGRRWSEPEDVAS